MKKLNVTFLLLSLRPFLFVAVPAEVVGQITVFQTGFEYNEEPIVFEPSDLNGAIDQVGLWSGLEFPSGRGNGAPDTVAFVDNPYGGRGFYLDRPDGDDGSGVWPNVEPNSDFTGSYFADLEKAVLLSGAEVSFDVAIRRDNGSNNNKSWDIIGRDNNGAESFHLRVSTNEQVASLGTITDGGDTVNFDLPTTVGEDMPGDLLGLGNPPWATTSIFGSVKVLMVADGYVIDFAHNPLTLNGNAYTTDVIPYNGPGADLAQLEFTYEASDANGRSSGYFLDNILVTGFTEQPTLGDFDSNGTIDLADFSVLSSNFNQPGDLSTGDMNFDGNVDLFDFFLWRDVFNQPAGAAAAHVPEPGTGFLLGLGFIAFTQWIRRRASRNKIVF